MLSELQNISFLVVLPKLLFTNTDYNHFYRLNQIYIQIEELQENQWLAFQQCKLRKHLKSLLNQMIEMPASMRTNDAYMYKTIR